MHIHVIHENPAWLEPLAHVLKNLGSDRVWLVHGADGLDEMTVTGVTYVVARRP